MKIHFDDGITINTDGRWRTLKLKDGWYAVGKGNCIPCSSKEEAEAFVAEFSRSRTYQTHPNLEPITRPVPGLGRKGKA